MVRKLKLNCKAQHVIEFSVLIVVVVLTIVLMRNYVLRSVFAHLKMWEDETNESLRNTGVTEGRCADSGGTTVTVGGVTFCKFTGSSCPSGWTQYLNWSTTTPRSCPNLGDGCKPLTTTESHTWANHTIETLPYGSCSMSFGICRCVNANTCTAITTEIGCI